MLIKSVHQCDENLLWSYGRHAAFLLEDVCSIFLLDERKSQQSFLQCFLIKSFGNIWDESSIVSKQTLPSHFIDWIVQIGSLVVQTAEVLAAYAVTAFAFLVSSTSWSVAFLHQLVAVSLPLFLLLLLLLQLIAAFCLPVADTACCTSSWLLLWLVLPISD